MRLSSFGRLAEQNLYDVVIARDTERIVEVIGAQVAAVTARCEARGVALMPRLAQVTIATDGEMLRVVVHNLLDNAASYVDAGGTIEVVLTEDRLVIANSGCALAAADAARVFERFWLVAVMGGAIGVEIAGGRFVVTLTWPRAA
jgi:signal transduction histidine kinase